MGVVQGAQNPDQTTVRESIRSGQASRGVKRDLEPMGIRPEGWCRRPETSTLGATSLSAYCSLRKGGSTPSDAKSHEPWGGQPLRRLPPLCYDFRMPDFLTPETRSRVMSRIRSKDTKPELLLRRALFAAGHRGWRCHAKAVPGKPDLAFTRRKVAVFVDGRFWHGHPDYFTPGKSGAYWDAKIARTQERDRAANEQLAAAGWTVLRFWDFEIEQELPRCVEEVTATLRLTSGRPS